MSELTESMRSLQDILSKLHATHGDKTQLVKHQHYSTMGKGPDSGNHPIVFMYNETVRNTPLLVQIRRSVLEPYTIKPLEENKPQYTHLRGLFRVQVGTDVRIGLRAIGENFCLGMAADWYGEPKNTVCVVGLLRFVLDLHLAEAGVAIEEALNGL
jgi:hypothetical protein